ncbi:hypothetical protein Tco_0327791 [Tanacetum coccineum]
MCISKKNVIQYPRLHKAHNCCSDEEISIHPPRIEEDCHSMKMIFQCDCMRDVDSRCILDEDIQLPLMITRRKKRKQSVRESISPQKSLKITIRQKQVAEGEKDKKSYDDVNDSNNRLEPGSHKENPEHVDDDDDKEEEKVDKKEGDEMGSLETRTEEMQTPIPTTPRSPRKILSSDKNIDQELTDNVVISTATTSKDLNSKRRIPNKYNHLLGALYRMCRCQGYTIKNMERKATDDLIENNLKPSIPATIIEDFLPTTTTSTKTTSSADLQHQLYLKMKSNIQDQANNPALNNNNNKNGMHGVEETVIDEDERVPTIFDRARIEATLNDMLSNQLKNAKEHAYHLEQAKNFMENQMVWESRQEDIRQPILRPLIFFRPQRNLNEPPRYLYNKDLFFLKNGNTKEKKYILSLYKIHAERFLEANLEEKMNRWVRKEFKDFNEDARLSIQH